MSCVRRAGCFHLPINLLMFTLPRLQLVSIPACASQNYPHLHQSEIHAFVACLVYADMVFLGQHPLSDARSVLPAGFWAAVDVWVQKPQVVNKRLCGSQSQPYHGNGPCLSQVRGDLSQATAGEDLDLLRNIADEVDPSHVLLRTLIPKTNPHYTSEPCNELVMKDPLSGTVTFVPLKKMHEESIQVMRSNVYQIQLAHVKDEEWSISIRVLCPEGWQSDGVVHPKQMWLVNDLLPKLAKWSMEQKRSEFKDTLSLISVIRYAKLYQELKDKYKEIVMVWPEVTDPEKFVYEDVAIATYLLILWEDERAAKGLFKKQSFVDLGCGNGLLVHILANEGHQGKGLDVRRRKIWDMYGEKTHLEECAITPSDDYLFPDVDWLIGNHSDELTPWLPMIAARSSYFCCYFVLPCCFFNFYGKYIRKKSKQTQYREYLDFITKVGIECGFEVEEDCLRIPSTKRVCLIGKSRIYEPKDESLIDEKRKQFIKKQQSSLTTLNKDFNSCCATDSIPMTNYSFNRDDLHSDETANLTIKYTKNDSKTTGNTNWLVGFLPRDKIEQTRNCASLPRDFIDQVVLQVANLLLTTNENLNRSVSKENVNTWNCGGSLPLRDVAEYLGNESLQRLKKECGGLQTLLRNNHQVFDVHDARVHIRDWRKEDTVKRPKQDFRKRPPCELLKTRLCWFFVNHPDGCPLESDKCLFAHGTDELREVRKTRKQKP